MNHRGLAGRISSRFQTSPAAVKDALLAEGLIVLAYAKREGETQKINHYYKLTKKKLNANPVKQIVVSDKWEDGTPKSKGNAFDLSIKACTMFSKHEIAQMKQKFHNNNPITLYSRA
jgi:hypothetical protein